ncbi:uncharacterized protein C9orf85 homolog [Sphaeramia orbicularis]|uniref:Uncharacterized protein n=1 Tax=Sphaeramia orbicularis TaxID=375764 RepID=A0A672Z5C7_9TELE|nr:uncharacterized protein C9orf85 homolog [Sphaeramia orbicularis]
MSSQKGNVSRSRGQKHQNTTAFKNDKYGATVQVKKAKAKIHDGLCQHCKDVLEWKVKYNKYKPLTQPRKCVKCSQKTVKDAYHIICKPCSLQLDICCKCGKKEEIIIPVNSHLDKDDQEEGCQQKKSGRKNEDLDIDEDEEDDDFGDLRDDDDNEDCDSDSERKTKDKAALVQEVSQINIKD